MVCNGHDIYYNDGNYPNIASNRLNEAYYTNNWDNENTNFSSRPAVKMIDCDAKAY